MKFAVVTVCAVLLGILALGLCVNAPAQASQAIASRGDDITAHGNGHCHPDDSALPTNGCMLACAMIAASVPQFTFIPQQEPARFQVVQPGRTGCAIRPEAPPPRRFWLKNASYKSTL
jgi:hypothetical protein